MPNRSARPITGRCYCGQVAFDAPEPTTVVYCHCADCKRWTSAAAPTFAGFVETEWRTPQGVTAFRPSDMVTRWHCARCGSAIAAWFEYLPGQIYVPLGVIDQAERLVPERHLHAAQQLPWTRKEDGLPREPGTGRDQLNSVF